MSDPWYDYWVNHGHGYDNGVNLRPADYSYEKAAEFINQTLNIKSGDKLLDVGCGNGQMIEQFGEYTSFISGVDYSKNMVSLALGLAVKKGLSGSYFEAKADNLREFDSNIFDAVICMAVIQYYPEPDMAKKAVNEMLRVCKKGGVVYMGDVLDRAVQTTEKDGMRPYFPQDLFEGEVKIIRSYFEPERRFDLIIKK